MRFEARRLSSIPARSMPVTVVWQVVPDDFRVCQIKSKAQNASGNPNLRFDIFDWPARAYEKKPVVLQTNQVFSANPKRVGRQISKFNNYVKLQPEARAAGRKQQRPKNCKTTFNYNNDDKFSCYRQFYYTINKQTSNSATARPIQNPVSQKFTYMSINDTEI